eukprot:NODE_2518_length_682_cov_341.121643_g2060_i0.p1 GENE.NODE_2518_length_682_cov_341.121643_g2060_i0~~NODE_2518_length_682_cov_341.121643_g2060_i0.p1  ORF type:complete len:149 (-),score=25.98 NODE_2518_length_682_cov_341.121643_g2060_i0:164-610(-)
MAYNNTPAAQHYGAPTAPTYPVSTGYTGSYPGYFPVVAPVAGYGVQGSYPTLGGVGSLAGNPQLTSMPAMYGHPQSADRGAYVNHYAPAPQGYGVPVAPQGYAAPHIHGQYPGAVYTGTSTVAPIRYAAPPAAAFPSAVPTVQYQPTI